MIGTKRQIANWIGVWTFGLILACGVPVAAQSTAEDIAQLLREDLSPTGAMEGGKWFTNENATQGLGIIYAHIPGSAGSVSIHAGLYGFFDSGWVKLKDVQGLFGSSPEDARFVPGQVEITMLMLGPDEPRCCPTLRVRWSIDLNTGIATRLN